MLKTVNIAEIIETLVIGAAAQHGADVHGSRTVRQMAGTTQLALRGLLDAFADELGVLDHRLLQAGLAAIAVPRAVDAFVATLGDGALRALDRGSMSERQQELWVSLIWRCLEDAVAIHVQAG